MIYKKAIDGISFKKALIETVETYFPCEETQDYFFEEAGCIIGIDDLCFYIGHEEYRELQWLVYNHGGDYRKFFNKLRRRYKKYKEERKRAFGLKPAA